MPDLSMRPAMSLLRSPRGMVPRNRGGVDGTVQGLPAADAVRPTAAGGPFGRTIREVFEPLGWKIEPLETSGHDPAHLDSPKDPPTRRR
jgi:hypothetical protein